MDEAAGLLHALLASPLKGGNFSPALLEWLAGYSLARREYQECIRSAQLLVDTNNASAAQQAGWSMLGQAHLALGDKAAAAEAFRQCLAHKGAARAGAEAALELGNMAWAEHNPSNAVTYYAQSAALAADESLLEVRARAYAGLGRAAKAAGDTEGASRYFMSVAILYDDPALVPECLYEAAEAFKKLGRNDDAAKALKELHDRYPQSDWAKRAPATP
jgi:TolA-binding protein